MFTSKYYIYKQMMNSVISSLHALLVSSRSIGIPISQDSFENACVKLFILATSSAIIMKISTGIVLAFCAVSTVLGAPTPNEK
jgi:hypothetical protein